MRLRPRRISTRLLRGRFRVTSTIRGMFSSVREQLGETFYTSSSTYPRRFDHGGLLFTGMRYIFMRHRRWSRYSWRTKWDVAWRYPSLRRKDRSARRCTYHRSTVHPTTPLLGPPTLHNNPPASLSACLRTCAVKDVPIMLQYVSKGTNRSLKGTAPRCSSGETAFDPDRADRRETGHSVSLIMIIAHLNNKPWAFTFGG